MSWLRFEDNMFDHPKWRRALRRGGDGAFAVWVRLVSWCSRNLTDGFIPADMVAEVAETRGDRSRRRALEALIESMLVARDEQGACTIVDYLQRNPSRADVLAAREAARGRKEKHRLKSSGTPESQRGTPSLERDAATTQSPSHPNPLPIPSQGDPPVVPQGDAKPPKRPKAKTRLPDDFAPNAATIAFARERNVSLEAELPKFVNHHTAKGNLMADWQAALRHWVVNTAEWGPQKHPPGTRPAHPVDRAIQRGVTELERIRVREAEEERRMT